MNTRRIITFICAFALTGTAFLLCGTERINAEDISVDISAEESMPVGGVTIETDIPDRMGVLKSGENQVSFTFTLSNFNAEYTYFEYAAYRLTLPEGFTVSEVTSEFTDDTEADGVRGTVFYAAPGSPEAVKLNERFEKTNDGYVIISDADTRAASESAKLFTLTLNVPEKTEDCVNNIVVDSVFGRYSEAASGNGDSNREVLYFKIEDGVICWKNNVKYITGVRGDADLDGKVTQNDATLILGEILSRSVHGISILPERINTEAAGEYSAALSEYLCDADLSDSGEAFDQIDATAILKAVLYADIAGEDEISDEIWAKAVSVTPEISEPEPLPEPEPAVVSAASVDWSKYGSLCSTAVKYSSYGTKINLEYLLDNSFSGRNTYNPNIYDTYKPVFSEELITFEGYTENSGTDINRIIVTDRGIMYVGLKEAFGDAVVYYTPFDRNDENVCVECTDYKYDTDVKFSPEAVSYIVRYVRGDITAGDSNVKRYRVSREEALSFGDDFSAFLNKIKDSESSEASFEGIPDRLTDLCDILNNKEKLRIIDSTAENNNCYKEGKPIEVKGIMLHSVGEERPWAESWLEEFNAPDFERHVCVHAFIDGYSGDVYQVLPWEMRGWHSGGILNDSYIGVEMCESSRMQYYQYIEIDCEDPDLVQKSARTAYSTAVKLFSVLCRQYNLDPLKDIISHNEGRIQGIASSHFDPEHYWKAANPGYTMNGFRNDVKAAMELDFIVETGSRYEYTGECQWQKLEDEFREKRAAAEPVQNQNLKSVDEVAREVLSGLWGSGSERKRRLVSAGYDYDEVQRRVNELLS